MNLKEALETGRCSWHRLDLAGAVRLPVTAAVHGESLDEERVPRPGISPATNRSSVQPRKFFEGARPTPSHTPDLRLYSRALVLLVQYLGLSWETGTRSPRRTN